jgi:transporter family protein
MWLLLALGSAVFAGLVSVLGKKGLVGVPSNLATAVRSVVALVLAWVLVLGSGSFSQLGQLSFSSVIFILLSGMATGISWLFYFRALKLGRATQVVAVDRTSLLFTGMFAILFLGEGSNLFAKILGLVLVVVGTLVLVGRIERGAGFAWLLPAIGSMVFAVVTTVLAKIGLASVDSNLATALRTAVVVLFAAGISFSRGEVKAGVISRSNGWFLVLSGLATGFSWLCYFGALKLGQVSLVAPIDKLSIVFVAIFGFLFLGERLSRCEVLGLLVVVAGTLVLVL